MNFLNEYKNQRILIAPLNWGLGHASRCVPIIRRLQVQNEVIIGSDGLALEWLRLEFPKLKIICLPSYDVTYQIRPMWINALRQAPHWYRTLRKEHCEVDSVVKEFDIDMIISDHRLGVRSSYVRSILLIHQILIAHQNRIFQSIATCVQKWLINKFDEVWIPDSHHSDQQNLSGVLSAPNIRPPKSYIGSLSRFSSDQIVTRDQSKELFIAILLSGPEPARTELEITLFNILEDCLSEDHKIEKVIFIRGSSSDQLPLLKSKNSIDVIGLANSAVIRSAINQADLVICRSGYSSIMDLVKLNQKALLVPTPRQPEQEYLALRHGTSDLFRSVDQCQLTKEIVLNVLKWVQSSSK